MNIGIISVQGDISEHIGICNRAMRNMKLKGKVIPVKTENDLTEIDGLIIPGGESTAIYTGLSKAGIVDSIKSLDIPIMGTCAGCVLLAKKIIGFETQPTLGLMNISVKRNAFGRQKESFECELDIKGIKKGYRAIFIRAPVIVDISDDCEIFAKIDTKIVFIRENKYIALSFHPELTHDTVIHEYFFRMVKFEK